MILAFSFYGSDEGFGEHRNLLKVEYVERAAEFLEMQVEVGAQSTNAQ